MELVFSNSKKKFKFEVSEKIPKYNQRISISVYKFSSRNTMYSILGKK
jgi:hypothetical protein